MQCKKFSSYCYIALKVVEIMSYIYKALEHRWKYEMGKGRGVRI